jgi:diaminopimelate decarboxylase
MSPEEETLATKTVAADTLEVGKDIAENAKDIVQQIATPLNVVHFADLLADLEVTYDDFKDLLGSIAKLNVAAKANGTSVVELISHVAKSMIGVKL